MKARAITFLAILALALGVLGPAPAMAADPVAINHLVVLMQENHTFDNYFGTFPGADGIPKKVCQPVTRTGSSCVAPYHFPTSHSADPDHSSQSARSAYDDGRMDGFADTAGG